MTPATTMASQSTSTTRATSAVARIVKPTRSRKGHLRFGCEDREVSAARSAVVSAESARARSAARSSGSKPGSSSARCRHPAACRAATNSGG